MADQRLRAALIGCGRIAPSHIKALVKNQNSIRLVAICDLVAVKAEKIRERYLKQISDAENAACSIKTYTNFQDVLANPEIDMVAVAADSGAHAEIALAALEAGKHVLVEKPMALDTREARKMISLAASRSLTLGLCHQNRFNPPVQLLRRSLDTGEFGKLLYGTVNVRWFRDESYYTDAWRGTYARDGGCLMNQSIHGIDLLLWVFGEPERVYAETDRFLRPIEAEDAALAVVRFKNGCLGTIEGTTCIFPDNLEETLNVFGATGTCCLDGIAVNKVKSFVTAKSGEYAADSVSQQVSSVYGEGHGAVYQDFIDAIHTGRPPYIDGNAGYRALEMVLAIYKSAATHQPVTFPLGDYSTLEAQRDYAINSSNSNLTEHHTA